MFIKYLLKSAPWGIKSAPWGIKSAPWETHFALYFSNMPPIKIYNYLILLYIYIYRGRIYTYITCTYTHACICEIYFCFCTQVLKTGVKSAPWIIFNQILNKTNILQGADQGADFKLGGRSGINWILSTHNSEQ